jgi:AmiR/NasT family two-component response regulator
MLKDIRTLNVVVVHPQDQDGDELGAQLQRIGCRFQTFWPELDALPVDTDLVLLAVRPETLSRIYGWMGKPSTPPVIPVLTFENPITLAAVLQLDAFTTIASPVRSAGLLTAIALTMHQSKARRARERYIERLEQKSAHGRVIQQATRIVMETRGLAEAEAYQLLRSQAMLKRESIERVASGIVKAQAALSF